MSMYHVCWGGLIPIGGLLLGSAWSVLGSTTALTAAGSVVMGFAVYVARHQGPARR
jgi:hypothetical protein